MNSKPQSGRTRHEAESGDGTKVKLLAGTDKGSVGEIIVLSTSVALQEIAAGRAVAV